MHPQTGVKRKGVSCWSMRHALADRQSTPLVKLVRKRGPQTVSWHVAGSSSATVAPAVSLPPEDANRVTGEEEERSVYTGEPLRAPHREPGVFSPEHGNTMCSQASIEDCIENTQNTAELAALAYLHMKEVYVLHTPAYEPLRFKTNKSFVAVSYSGRTVVT